MRSVTMDDVAREAGVSRALVSIAYRGVGGVSDDTRARIFHAGNTLGYRPNRIASQLASKVGNTVGMFLQDLHNDVFADVYDGVRGIIETYDQHLVLSVGAPGGERDEYALDALARLRVDVVIAVGLLEPDVSVQRFSYHVPVVVVARQIPEVDSVFLDNLLGARAAVNHLVELGHRQIAFLANPQTDGYLDRQRGYTLAMRSAGLVPRVVPSQYTRKDAADDIGPVLGGPNAPTAVFTHNDQAALGTLDAAAALGLSVPGDLSVVGYDNSSVSGAPGTQLTTVDIHGRQLGRAAAEVAISRLANPQAAQITRSFSPSLVVRSTTAPPARA